MHASLDILPPVCAYPVNPVCAHALRPHDQPYGFLARDMRRHMMPKRLALMHASDDPIPLRRADLHWEAADRHSDNGRLAQHYHTIVNGLPEVAVDARLKLKVIV